MPGRPGVSRRALLRGSSAAGLLVGGTLLGARPAAAATTAHRAARADDLADMFGVVAVTSTTRGVYGQRDLVQARLAELRVRYVRNRLFAGNNKQLDFIRQLNRAAGVKMDLLLGDPTGKGGTPEQLVSLAAAELQGCIATFEGANEWNLKGGRDWAPQLRQHQRRLWAAVQQDRRVAGVPVLGPSLGMRKDYDVLGNLTDALDAGSMHLYQGGYAPGNRVSEQLQEIKRVVGAKPVHVTETGWHNAYRSSATHHYTPEDVAATYAPRVYLDYFSRGVPRVYLFQLCDDRPDSTFTDHEAHFGLVRSDFSRKPVFTAMANFMSLVDDRGPAFSTGSLQYDLSGAPADLRSQLVQRRDGRFLLFLWRDVAIYDPVRGTRIRVGSQDVQVRLGQTAAMRVFQPTSGVSAQSVRTSNAITLPVGAEVLALELAPR